MVTQAITKPAPAPPTRRWPPEQGDWTYDDYALLPDNGMRYEVLEGELFMAPAPGVSHQAASMKLSTALHMHVHQGNLGRVFAAPIDVILSERATPVQPDLVYVSQERAAIIQTKYIDGAPDLVVEILSESTAAHDRRRKFQLYAQAGVREYWLVDPDERAIEVYVLRGSAYALLESFDTAAETRSEVLPDFTVRVADIV